MPRAVGSPAVMTGDIPPVGDEELLPCLRKFKRSELKKVPGTFLIRQRQISMGRKQPDV